MLNSEQKTEASGTKPISKVSSLPRAVAKSKSFGAAAHNDRVDSILLRLDTLRAETSDNRLVVGISSANRKAGVSVIAGKLAVRAAEMALGRVLLIDGNFSTPSQAKQFGLRSKVGLADILSREVDIPELLNNGVVDGLHVLPAGSSEYLTTVTVMPDIVSAMLNELRSEFDLIIIDMPPVKNSARCLALARQTDGVILVVDAEQTRTREARAAITTLTSSSIRVLGTVLNRVSRTLPRWLERWF